MSNAEVGLFIRLLCLQAEHGSIPDDVERIVRAYGEEARTLWAGVKPKFNRGSTEGTLVNERLCEVLAARDEFRKRQSEKGKASAAIRALGSTKPKKRFNRGSTVVEPLGDRDRDIVLTQKGKERARETDPRFDELWKVYEGKGAKGKAREYWEKLSDEDKSAIITKAPAYVLATSGDDLKYRKNLEGWINPQERRWEGPIPTRRDEVSKPKVWTKEEAIIEVRRLRELHGADFQTHHVPKDVLTAYRQMS